MLSRLFFLTGLAVALFISGCAAPPPPKPNALQIQAMQTREFKASKKKAFNAVMTVFQNDGYTISSANMGTGYITAKSPTQDHPFVDANGNMSTGEKVALGVLEFMTTEHTYGGRHKPVHVNYTVNVSAFVTPAKKGSTRVRLAFLQNKVVSGGDTNNVSTQILDTNLYQKTFNEIRQQLFVAADL